MRSTRKIDEKAVFEKSGLNAKKGGATRAKHGNTGVVVTSINVEEFACRRQLQTSRQGRMETIRHHQVCVIHADPSPRHWIRSSSPRSIPNVRPFISMKDCKPLASALESALSCPTFLSFSLDTYVEIVVYWLSWPLGSQATQRITQHSVVFF